MTEEVAVFSIPDEADPPTRALIEQVNAAEAPAFETLTPEVAREVYRTWNEKTNFPSVELGAVEELAIPAEGRTIGARLYRPPGSAPAAPLLLYFHGGGFVIGDLETHDPICRRICREAEALVLAVDYRLAPEHPFPAAVEDAFAAFDWLAPAAASLGADPERLWVGGDSAGGTLAAALARRAAAPAEGTERLAGQALIYPALDRVNDYPSHAAYAEMFPIPLPVLAWFDRHYFQGKADKASPLASPGLGQPEGRPAPALIVAAGLDPLLDEATAYAARLERQGVSVCYRCHDGTVHGFLDKGRLLPHAGQTVALIASAIKGDGSLDWKPGEGSD